MPEMGQQLSREACEEALSMCACTNFRRVSRAVTRFFDEALHPAGLRSTQFVILLALYIEQPAPIALLARQLVADRTTLIRNLAVLEKAGLVRSKRDKGRRLRQYSLTARGSRALHDAVPLWEQAQSAFVDRLGGDTWGDLRNGLTAALDSVQKL